MRQPRAQCLPLTANCEPQSVIIVQKVQCLDALSRVAGRSHVISSLIGLKPSSTTSVCPEEIAEGDDVSENIAKNFGVRAETEPPRGGRAGLEAPLFGGSLHAKPPSHPIRERYQRVAVSRRPRPSNHNPLMVPTE